ncbi:MAG: protease complex subunit PrcB family protein, partial [Candidatus Parabeggiatoa sp.]|nr:protease complex subunit PrcB family protein [Candidatus Parabeggiatoa sp.]
RSPENDNQVYEAKMELLPYQDSLHFVVTELEEVENVPENGESDIPFIIISEVPDSLMEVGVQQFVVIREKVFFDSFWFNSFWPEFPDSLEEREFAIPEKTPVIDFTEKMVIAVFLGFFPNDGFRIDIKHIVETNDSIIVTVIIRIPDHNDPTVGLTDGFIYPHQIIKLKKSHKLVLFNTLIEVSPSWPPRN